MEAKCGLEPDSLCLNISFAAYPSYVMADKCCVPHSFFVCVCVRIKLDYPYMVLRIVPGVW